MPFDRSVNQRLGLGRAEQQRTAADGDGYEADEYHVQRTNGVGFPNADDIHECWRPVNRDTTNVASAGFDRRLFAGSRRRYPSGETRRTSAMPAR